MGRSKRSCTSAKAALKGLLVVSPLKKGLPAKELFNFSLYLAVSGYWRSSWLACTCNKGVNFAFCSPCLLRFLVVSLWGS